jgi:hypothetical protein
MHACKVSPSAPLQKSSAGSRAAPSADVSSKASRKSPVPSMQFTEVRAHLGVPFPGAHVSLIFCPHEHVFPSFQS